VTPALRGLGVLLRRTLADLWPFSTERRYGSLPVKRGRRIDRSDEIGREQSAATTEPVLATECRGHPLLHRCSVFVSVGALSQAMWIPVNSNSRDAAPISSLTSRVLSHRIAGAQGELACAELRGNRIFSSILGIMPRRKKTEEHRILVIDDDDGVREAMVSILQVMGYFVASAINGKEALDYLREAATPDLIISDLAMPVMDGRQFRREQVKDPRLAKVPVIVVSALSDQTDIDANEIFIKPVDVDILLAAVARYCRGEPMK
jgi:CheY-like chemotaxis protein